MSEMLCNPKNKAAHIGAEFNEFDANLELGNDDFDDFDAALQQINPRAANAGGVAPTAGAIMMPTAGMMPDEDEFAAAGASMDPTVMPADAGVRDESGKTVLEKILETQQHMTTLLAHFVSNSVQDSHQRTLKAMSTGQNTVTHEVNMFVQGSFREWADHPERAVLMVPAGALPHINGTLLDVTITDGSTTASGSLMMNTGGIKNLAHPTVVSTSAKGVCEIPAKAKTLKTTPIVTSIESDFTREFKAQWSNITAENLMESVVKNPIKDPKTGKVTMKYLIEAEHPIAALIITKLKSNGINHVKQWSEVNQKYTFNSDEVHVAANELRKKLTVEDASVDLDKISFPLTRSVVSAKAMSDRSVQATRNRWLDTEEIGAYVKSGNAEAELDKKFYVKAKARITYAPSPDSERKSSPAVSSSSTL